MAEQRLASAPEILAWQFEFHPRTLLLGRIAALRGGGQRAAERAYLDSARRAVQLMPVSKDVWIRGYRVVDLAHVYATVGEHELAIEQLRSILTVPSPLSAGLLRLDPRFDALRGDARFQRLLVLHPR